MKITAIGTGNAFSNKNYNQCFMLEETEVYHDRDKLVESGYDVQKSRVTTTRRMLVDCGYQVGAALYKAGVDLKTITDVYVSHAHADHIGFLEGLGFQRYDWMNKPESSKYDTASDPRALPIKRDHSYYAPFLHANDKLMQELWENSLKGGMKSIEGLDATLDTFFYTNPIKPGDSFFFGNWKCETIQQIHIMSGSYISNTFGLFMTNTVTNKKLYFTTDSQHCSPRQVEIFYKQADIIFQDCECIGVDTVTKTSKFTSGVHANYAQLAGWESANSIKLSKDIRGKMWLGHYQDFVTDGKDGFGNDCDWDALAKKDGFEGFLKVGKQFEV